MTKSSKSATARRREQLRRQQEQQNRMIRIGAGVLAVIALAIIAYLIWQSLPQNQNNDTAASPGEPLAGDRPLAAIPPAERNNYYEAYPEFVIDLENEYEAIIRTEHGDIHVQLLDDEAPQTVNNFVFLANQGFYDGTTFHRVLDDFMAQGGDPTGTGTGGPGYQFADEFDAGLTFDRPGLLAMANSGPATNGSQFFITFVPTPHLNGLHTIFGEVVEGMEILDEITRRDPNQPNQPEGDLIERIDIVEIDA